MRLAATAGVAGGLSVACGAFGAHGLEDVLSAEALGWWETATFYLMTHAVAGLAMGLQTRVPSRPGFLMVGGGVLFAATLYAMALGAPTILGAVTPIGGTLMILGWVDLVVAALRSR
ncbi:MAG: DUF423 domain-containing protein [Pseudomonadota bacterium]